MYGKSLVNGNEYVGKAPKAFFQKVGVPAAAANQ
jgi:hypothetical protein